MSTPEFMSVGREHVLTCTVAHPKPGDAVTFTIAAEDGTVLDEVAGNVENNQARAVWKAHAKDRKVPVKVTVKASLRGEVLEVGPSTIDRRTRINALGWIEPRDLKKPLGPPVALAVDPTLGVPRVDAGALPALRFDVDDGHGNAVGEELALAFVLERVKDGAGSEVARFSDRTVPETRFFERPLQLGKDIALPGTFRVVVEVGRAGAAGPVAKATSPAIHVEQHAPVVTKFFGRIAGKKDPKDTSEPELLGVGPGQALTLTWEVHGAFDEVRLEPIGRDVRAATSAKQPDGSVRGETLVDPFTDRPDANQDYVLVASFRGQRSNARHVTVAIVDALVLRLADKQPEDGKAHAITKRDHREVTVDEVRGAARRFEDFDPHGNDWRENLSLGSNVAISWKASLPPGARAELTHGTVGIDPKTKALQTEGLKAQDVTDDTRAGKGALELADRRGARATLDVELAVVMGPPDRKKRHLLAVASIRIREDFPFPVLEEFHALNEAVVADGGKVSLGRLAYSWKLKNAQGSKLRVELTAGEKKSVEEDWFSGKDPQSGTNVPKKTSLEGATGEVVATATLINTLGDVAAAPKTVKVTVEPDAPPPKKDSIFLKDLETKQPLAGKLRCFDSVLPSGKELTPSPLVFDKDGAVPLEKIPAGVKRIEVELDDPGAFRVNRQSLDDNGRYLVTKELDNDPNKQLLFVAGQFRSGSTPDVPPVLRQKPDRNTTIHVSKFFPGKRVGAAFKDVKHFFVLMMENRSYDHALGSNDVPEADGILDRNLSFTLTDESGPKSYTVNRKPDQKLQVDIGHELWHAHWNLTGTMPALNANGDANNAAVASIGAKVDMSGFLEPQFQRLSGRSREAVDLAYAKEIAAGLKRSGTSARDYAAFSVFASWAPEDLPIINRLAKEFVTCDRWFSSLPGPTWPNRLFVHAGTSGGLDDSPGNAGSPGAVSRLATQFQIRHVYEAMQQKGGRFTWRVVSPDALPPQVLSLRGMPQVGSSNGPHVFTGPIGFAEWKALLSLASLPGGYPNHDGTITFIEPSYGDARGIALSSDPTENFGGGSSQHPTSRMDKGEQFIKEIYEALSSSAIWNESALIVLYDEHGGFFDHVVPPAAIPVDANTPKVSIRGFDFARLGVRVPCVIASPRIPQGVVDHTIYDHASMVATLALRFGFPGSFGPRVDLSNHFGHLFTLTSPRSTAGFKLPAVNPPSEPLIREDEMRNVPVTGNTMGFLGLLVAAASVKRPARAAELRKRFLQVRTQGDADELARDCNEILAQP